MAKKKRTKRDKFRKVDDSRNRGKIFCTVSLVCSGECRNLHLKRGGKVCSEAFYKTIDGESTVTRL